MRTRSRTGYDNWVNKPVQLSIQIDHKGVYRLSMKYRLQSKVKSMATMRNFGLYQTNFIGTEHFRSSKFLETESAKFCLILDLQDCAVLSKFCGCHREQCSRPIRSPFLLTKSSDTQVVFFRLNYFPLISVTLVREVQFQLRLLKCTVTVCNIVKSICGIYLLTGM
jgi:hypothetical protein